jgi:hypothetical protein
LVSRDVVTRGNKTRNIVSGWFSITSSTDTVVNPESSVTDVTESSGDVVGATIGSTFVERSTSVTGVTSSVGVETINTHGTTGTSNVGGTVSFSTVGRTGSTEVGGTSSSRCGWEPTSNTLGTETTNDRLGTNHAVEASEGSTIVGIFKVGGIGEGSWHESSFTSGTLTTSNSLTSHITVSSSWEGSSSNLTHVDTHGGGISRFGSWEVGVLTGETLTTSNGLTSRLTAVGVSWEQGKW